MAAWKKASESEGGGIVVVPLGIYLLKGTITFEGPCKGQTLINMEGSTLKAFTEPLLGSHFIALMASKCLGMVLFMVKGFHLGK